MINLYSGYALNTEALEHFVQGRTNGTIGDNCAEVIEIILNQEIVSYCSAHDGTYQFDYNDLEEV